MHKLFDLPIDLVLEISSYLSPVSLSKLARTSHNSRKFFNPLLYSLHGSHILKATTWDGRPGQEQILLHFLNRTSRPFKENPHLGCKALSCAASAGFTEIVRLLLNDGIPPDYPENHENQRPHRPRSPLACAARRSHPEIVEILLAAGADIGRFGPEDVYWALRGVKPYNYATARILISHGVDIHYSSPQGNLLHLFVAEYLDLSVVSLLLDHGVSMATRNEDGLTPLDLAIEGLSGDDTGIHDVVALLLRRGASADLPGDQGQQQQQPLHTAVRAASPRVVKLLLDSGADVHAYNQDNMSPLHIAAGRQSSGGEQIIRLLLNAGACPATTPASPGAPRVWTPLHTALASTEMLHLRQLLDAWLVRFPGLPSPNLLLIAAAALGDIPTLKRLLDRDDVDVNAGINGATALMKAAQKGHDEAIELLLSRGADVNLERNFLTALHYALESGVEFTTSIRLLFPGTCLDPDIMDTESILRDVVLYRPSLFGLFIEKMDGQTIYGQRPLEAAARQGYIEIVQLLHEVGARFSYGQSRALIQAVKGRHGEVVEYLLGKGVSAVVRYYDEELVRETPLIHAVRAGHGDIVDILLANNGSTDGFDGRYGRDALMWAAQEGQGDIVRTLLAHGGDLSAVDDGGHNALSLAASYGHAAIIIGLVDAGAVIDHVNHDGRTPFLLAAHGGHIAAADELMKRGSNIRHRDCFGRSALILAAQKGHDDMVQWLAGQGMDLDGGDADGRTALSWAVGVNSSQTVKALLCAGCGMSKPDRRGRTPLRFAESDSMIACLYSADHRSLLT